MSLRAPGVESRALTASQQMIQDLKSDSQRWQQERENRAGRGGSPHVRDTAVSKPNAAVVAYQDSQTHASRQHWGPSESFVQPQQPARSSQHSGSLYATRGDNYTTAAPSSVAYAPQPAEYAATPSSYNTQPRTAQPVVDPYTGYTQASRDHPSYPPTQQYTGYAQPVAQDPYRQQPPPPAHVYAAPRYFGYFPNGYLVHR